jgi:hypothetical protein
MKMCDYKLQNKVNFAKEEFQAYFMNLSFLFHVILFQQTYL